MARRAEMVTKPEISRAVTPLPDAATPPKALWMASARDCASSRMATPTGWLDPRSTAAAFAGASSAVPSIASTSTTRGRPSVSVPVLSNATVLIRPSVSERRAALDQQAAARGGGEAGGDRGRGRDY
jgi:hypothetical protein